MVLIDQSEDVPRRTEQSDVRTGLNRTEQSDVRVSLCSVLNRLFSHVVVSVRTEQEQSVGPY